VASPQSNLLDALGVDAGRDPTERGRASVVIDVKDPRGHQAALRLVEKADILLEGFRPGVMERLGLGPDTCIARNSGLVYGRMTGWGQYGPLAQRAGHDLTYIAVAGVLRHIGRSGQPPVPPLNLVGDYGGGAMLLVTGVLAALVERAASGRGQVVDAAMVDGAAFLMTWLHGMRDRGLWNLDHGTNLLDSGAPFYDVYETADGKFVAVGCLEPQFYAQFVAGLGLDPDELPAQYDPDGWPGLRARFGALLSTRTRDEWDAVFAGTDACVAPVLDMVEAAGHPQMVARGVLVDVDGLVQPAPAPRFSRTQGALGSPVGSSEDPAQTLLSWGFAADEVRSLQEGGVLR